MNYNTESNTSMDLRDQRQMGAIQRPGIRPDLGGARARMTGIPQNNRLSRVTQ